MDYYFWVVRDGERTILFDCGFGAEAGRRRGRTLLVDPVTALTALGIDPATVTQLVVTHAHYDHIGNLQSFPAAEIVIARREFEFWTGPYAGRIQFAHSTEPDELDRLAAAAAQGRVRMVDETLDLAPGIELVVVGGHTPGQLVAQVAVHDEDGGPGAVILAADALHFYEELERDRPFFVVADLLDMYRGFDTLREMSEDPGRAARRGSRRRGAGPVPGPGARRVRRARRSGRAGRRTNGEVVSGEVVSDEQADSRDGRSGQHGRPHGATTGRRRGTGRRVRRAARAGRGGRREAARRSCRGGAGGRGDPDVAARQPRRRAGGARSGRAARRSSGGRHDRRPVDGGARPPPWLCTTRRRRWASGTSTRVSPGERPPPRRARSRSWRAATPRCSTRSGGCSSRSPPTCTTWERPARATRPSC